jgi:hypothetical protein
MVLEPVETGRDAGAVLDRLKDHRPEIDGETGGEEAPGDMHLLHEITTSFRSEVATDPPSRGESFRREGNVAPTQLGEVSEVARFGMVKEEKVV